MALTFRAVGRGITCVITILLSAMSAIAADIDQQLAATAQEARQTLVVINWFYAAHHACPQPSRPEEIAAFRGELGDGFSVEPHGQCRNPRYQYARCRLALLFLVRSP